jgi:hypothetical protein
MEYGTGCAESRPAPERDELDPDAEEHGGGWSDEDGNEHVGGKNGGGLEDTSCYIVRDRV